MIYIISSDVNHTEHKTYRFLKREHVINRKGKDIWTQCTNGIDAFVSKRCLRGFDVTLDCVYIYTRNVDGFRDCLSAL